MLDKVLSNASKTPASGILQYNQFHSSGGLPSVVVAVRNNMLSHVNVFVYIHNNAHHYNYYLIVHRLGWVS